MMFFKWVLWQDGDTSKAAIDVLRDAVAYYQEKYDCYVTHVRAPRDFPQVAKIDGILLSRGRDVLSGHLMLTNQEDVQSEAGSTGRGE